MGEFSSPRALWPILAILVTCCNTSTGAVNLAGLVTPDEVATKSYAAPTVAQPLPCFGNGCFMAANLAPPVEAPNVAAGYFGQQLNAISPLPAAATAMQQGLGASSGEPWLGSLQAKELVEAKRVAAGLTQENAMLRDHINEWRKIGTGLADREARVADFLSKVRHNRLPGQGPQQQLLETNLKAEEASSVEAESEQHLENELMKVPQRAWHAAEWILVVAAFFVLYQLLLYQLHERAARPKEVSLSPISLQEPFSKTLAGPLAAWCSVPLSPLRRRFGMGPCTVEVSELELRVPGNPLATDRFCVGLQGGHTGLMKTRAAAGASRIVGSHSCISFAEVFRITVSSLDSVCTFSMHDQESHLHDVDVVARTELPVRLLTKMAAQAQGFARIDLSWEDARQCGSEQQATYEPQPYIALRIRTF